jgi:hypothetical protein
MDPDQGKAGLVFQLQLTVEGVRRTFEHMATHVKAASSLVALSVHDVRDRATIVCCTSSRAWPWRSAAVLQYLRNGELMAQVFGAGVGSPRSLVCKLLIIN